MRQNKQQYKGSHHNATVQTYCPLLLIFGIVVDQNVCMSNSRSTKYVVHHTTPSASGQSPKLQPATMNQYLLIDAQATVMLLLILEQLGATYIQSSVETLPTDWLILQADCSSIPRAPTFMWLLLFRKLIAIVMINCISSFDLHHLLSHKQHCATACRTIIG